MRLLFLPPLPLFTAVERHHSERGSWGALEAEVELEGDVGPLELSIQKLDLEPEEAERSGGVQALLKPSSVGWKQDRF